MKSDNCSCQYKCKNVYTNWRNVATKFNKTIIVYYGVCGHGKGQVDAVSAWEVKSLLSDVIVTDDFSPSSVNDIHKFLLVQNQKENFHF